MTRKRLLIVLVVAVLILSLTPSTLAQNCPSCCLPPCNPQTGGMTINQTYSGRTYFSFPNYDIYAFGAPQNTTELIQGTGSGSSIFVHNQSGLFWNGNQFLDHPAYHHELVTRYQYRNRDLGAWPRSLTPNSFTTQNQRMPLPMTPPPITWPPRRAEPVRTTMTFVAPPWVVPNSSPSGVSSAIPPGFGTVDDSFGAPTQRITTGRISDTTTPHR